MADDADKPVVIDFDFDGRKYRAEELQSRVGATVMDISTGDKTLDLWPLGARDKYGSEAMVKVTADYVASRINGLARLRAVNGAVADKALEEEQKRQAAAAHTPAP